MTRSLAFAFVALLALASAAASASPAAGVTLAADPTARELTALDGAIVWVTGAASGRQMLMQRRGGAVAAVRGAPSARFYRSLDLGRDRRGRLVLTYLRCDRPSRCVARRDDLAGGRAGIPGLAVPGCRLATAPALWLDRAAYGLECRTGGRFDSLRSGLYVKRGTAAPRRIQRPAEAARFGVSLVSSVDLRGQRVAAVLSDVYSYAYSARFGGGGLRSMRVASSEGESDEQAAGLALGGGDALWSLTTSLHVGDPLQTVINRRRGRCRAIQVLTGVDEERYPATDLALDLDGRRVLLIVPGTGIVTHAFAPGRTCV